MVEAVTPTFHPRLAGGEGAYVVDVAGACYLDCTGHAPLGHSHPKIVAAIERQARSLHAGAGDPSGLQQRLAAMSPLSRSVLFTTTEQAMDTAGDLAARLTGRGEIVLLTSGLEGRTQLPHWRTEPSPVQIVRRVRVGDVAGLSGVLKTGRVAAVIAEPLPQRGNYWATVRELTSHAGVLLGFDESRTALFRTGSWFAAEHLQITPDFTLLGPPLANGLPIAAVLCGEEMADLADSPSTANPLSLAAAEAVIDELSAPGIAARVERIAARLKRDLPHAASIGLLLTLDADEMIEPLADHGVLATAFDGRAIIAPPLTISDEELTLLIDAVACLEPRRGGSL